MTERVMIGGMGRQGDGVADTASGHLHVAYALPGELVDIDRAGERGLLRAVVEQSPERTDPVCMHFGVCGGCALQHWQAAPYLAWKRSLVVNALSRVGIDAPVAPIIDAHGAGRRRAVFHAAKQGETIVVGFAARRSNDIFAIEECPVLAPELLRALPVARKIAQIVRPAGKPLDLHFTTTLNGLEADIHGGGSLAPKAEAQLVSLARQERLARLSHHGKTLALLAEPAIRVGKATVILPAGSFLQATEAGEAALAAVVIEAAKGARSAADLFCGTGAFALRLAETAKVAAFDSSEAAVAALREAAKVPGLKPVKAEARDLFRWPLLAAELKPFDFLVLDPPRQGAEAQSRELARAKIKRIAYVSCDPESFARDARILCGGGYRLGLVTPVDQFRYSSHVELIGVFDRHAA